MSKGVDVRPAIAIGEKDERVVFGPPKINAAWMLQDAIGVGAFARDRGRERNLRGSGATHIGDLNRPWQRRRNQWRARRAAESRLTQEGDLATVSRPGGHRISRQRGTEIPQRLSW